MPYRDLYEHCQTLSPKISRKALRPKALEFSGIADFVVVKTTLDTAACRGFYLSARNDGHRLVQQFGKTIIVLARDMNYCWDRFVTIKEMMHLFDDELSRPDTGERFDRMLSEYAMGSGAESPTPDTLSEWYAFWMALGVVCPEEKRRFYIEEKAAGRVDDYAIALELRIPQQYVGLLFEERYPRIIDRVLTL